MCMYIYVYIYIYTYIYIYVYISVDLQDYLELKNVLFIIQQWNAKVGSQETPGVTGKFGHGVQNEAGQRLIEFSKRTHWS